MNYSYEKLKFDGLYHAIDDYRDASYFIKFYEDGTVITVSSTAKADPDIVAKWFLDEANLKDYSKGKFEIDENKIRFYSTSSYGRVDYKGVIAENEWSIDVNSYSHINGHKDRLVYYYDYQECFIRKEEKINSNCFIATAVYGSKNAEEVKALRAYRDQRLSKIWYGKLLIEIYYYLSPPIAKFISGNEKAKILTKKMIVDPVLRVVTKKS